MILENISEERLEEISQDEEFKKELQFWMESRKKGQAEKCWFDRRSYCFLMGKIAYFGMEFGLSEALQSIPVAWEYLRETTSRRLVT